MAPAPTPLEQDLQRIRTLFLQMCVRAETMVRQAVRSVVERDAHMARLVIQTDEELDALEVEIDDRCLRVLALRHPVGRDLRLVATVMKMVTDVERIGDLAVNVAQRGFDFGAGTGLEPGDDLPEMGNLAADLVRVASDAFVSRDADLARSLKERDKAVDELNRQAFASAIRLMAQHSDQVDRALALTSISKHLERVADHAVNLGEYVVFLVEGTDVRHR